METLVAGLRGLIDPQVAADLALSRVGTAQYGATRSDLLERIELELESHGLSLTHLPPPPRIATRTAESA